MIFTYRLFQPKVSIIMATYNRAHLLNRAVNSVLAQTFTAYELLIIDDGSTDNSFEIIKPYTEAHENIRYIRHSNRGQNFSVNTGIKLASSEYITFLDSDDEYLPTHLANRWAFMQENAEVDLAYGGFEIIGNPYLPDRNDPKKLVHIDNCAGLASFFAKKEVFERLGGFADIWYSADGDFMERAEKVFCTARFTERTYRYYRDMPDSICNNL